MMSRTHLYRSTGPSRPLLSVVLAAAWAGAGLLALLAAAPYFVGGLPLHGPAAALLERLFALLAGGAVIVGVGVLAAEFVAGRTRLRALRQVGAAALLVAGLFGAADGARRLLRPGTPAIAEAAGVPAPPVVPAVSTDVAGERLLWSGLALAAAVVILGGGLGAVRSWDRGM